MPSWLPFVLLLAPPAAAAAIAVLPLRRPSAHGLNVALSLVPVAAAVYFWREVLADRVPTAGPDALFRIDALSCLLALAVAVVGALAACLGPASPGELHYGPVQVRRFLALGNAFTATMLVAVTTNNVGVMWVAVEATTITSALLVPLHRSRASIEASWKYLLIGSVGIAVAFAGTVLAYVDFVNTAGRSDAALNWTALRASAAFLHPAVVQLAFVFVLVGYGTKAGLAPMHTWLPDAHSEAPAPLSAMMSGVLLAVAVYGIARWKAVVDAAVGPAFADRLLVILAVLSLAVAAFSLIEQRQVKRMLAYSSVEHTGLTVLGLALGPAGTFGALLHLLGHTLAKSVLFLLSGRILARYGSPDIADVRGLARTMPVTGALFAAAFGAILGLPPFGLFVSEVLLVRAGLAAGRPWLVATVLALVGLAFAALVRHASAMVQGRARDVVPRGEADPWALAPLLVPIAGLAALGLVLPAPVIGLLARAVEVLAP